MALKHFYFSIFGAEEGAEEEKPENSTEEKAGNTYTYEQLNEIASSRAERAEKSALKNFFSQAGLSEAEAQEAFEKFKTERASKAPNVSAIEKERDGYKSELESLKNANYLREKGVHADEIEFVTYKINQLVDEKTDFKKATDAFLKDNPRYTGSTYKMSGSAGNSNTGSGKTIGGSINDAIRSAARR